MLLTDLYGDILQEIMSHLSTYTMRCLSCTCSHFYNNDLLFNTIAIRKTERIDFDKLTYAYKSFQTYINKGLRPPIHCIKTLPEYGRGWIIGPGVYFNNFSNKRVEFSQYVDAEDLIYYKQRKINYINGKEIPQGHYHCIICYKNIKETPTEHSKTHNCHKTHIEGYKHSKAIYYNAEKVIEDPNNLHNFDILTKKDLLA